MIVSWRQECKKMHVISVVHVAYSGTSSCQLLTLVVTAVVTVVQGLADPPSY